MNPFLILSSLSVGFYLVILVALHRDTRRHRQSAVLTRSKGSFNTKTIHVLSTVIGVPSSRRNANVSKVTVPTFFASKPIAFGSARYPDQSRHPAHSAGLHQVQPSRDARPGRQESFHA